MLESDLVVNANQELVAMVADTLLVRLMLPLQHNVAGGAEAIQQGPVWQTKY